VHLVKRFKDCAETLLCATMPHAIAISRHCGGRIGSLLSIVAQSDRMGEKKGSLNAASKNNKSGETKNLGEREREKEREILSFSLSFSRKFLSLCHVPF